MKTNLLISAALFFFLMSGCMSTPTVSQVEQQQEVLYRYQSLPGDEKYRYEILLTTNVSEEVIGIMNDQIQSQMKRKDVLAPEDDMASKIIEIEILDFKMKHSTARIFLGAMGGGADIIESLIRVKDPKTDSIVTKFIVSSKDYGAATSHVSAQVRRHADQIVDRIKTSTD